MTTFQFVADMASVSPAVVLDLNVPPLNVKSYDLSPPDFVKSYATGSMLDGQRILSDTAQNRLLLISLQVVSTTAAGFSGAVESLGRQLAKDNILKFQPDNSAGPVFFRTFANPRYAAQVRSVLTCAVDYQIVSLEIEAEFPAYGPRVEVPGSPFTVSNSPAVTDVNPCSFDVTGIGGDMPTPLLIHATSTTVTGAPSGLMQKWSHIGMRRRGTPSGYSNVIQAELMTQGTDATITTDATMSGGSKSRISFASQNSIVLRLSDTFPADGVATVEARGEYIVYARVARTVAGGTIHIQLGYGSSSTAPIKNDQVVVPGTANNPVWVNLGKVPVPVGPDPIEHGFSGVQTKVVLPFVGIYADRISGTP